MAYKFRKGDAELSGAMTTDDIAYFYDTDTKIDWDNDYISLQTDGNDVLVVSGSRVGIGTSSPDHTLTISGSVSASSDMSASAFYGMALSASGDAYIGNNLFVYNNSVQLWGGLDLNSAGITATGPIADATTVSGSGPAYFGSIQTSGSVTLDGGVLSSSANVSASAFYGDGSMLQGVTGSGGGASPGGDDTQVQFNSGGSFDGDSKFTWNDGLEELAVSSISSSTYISASTVDIYTAIHFSQSATQTSDFNVASPGIPCYRVDTSSAVVTASLPALASGMEGRWVNIKDIGLSASTNNVVVEPNGSDTIDGATSLKIQANGGSVGLQADPDSTEWYIVFTN